MIRPYAIPVWKQAPFIRLLIPLITGIGIQWYLQISITAIMLSLGSLSIAYLLFLLLPIAFRYKLKSLQGLVVQLLFVALGLLLTWHKDIRHQNNWYGNYFKNGSYLVVCISEPLIEKAKSFKAEARVEQVIENGGVFTSTGNILLYFSKDSFDNALQYGDRIIIRKEPQRIQNSGNPGAFNYQRHAGFQNLFHQVFLKKKDWTHIEGDKKNWFYQFVYSARARVLSILRNTIHTGKDELGIAQALLIGYTNDLDKDLVQAYSNTGVVHIIAISGMHLGLIYVLLIFVFAKIPLVSRSKTTQLVLILICLWLFALLTGASPSVLRAAVMFSCIAIGKNLKKQVSIYTSLAASAFILLCYNPYYLWAVGFQLSYLAVLGIVIFQKPIYNIVYIKNKWIDKVWQLMSVSTAAQLLTFPACIYYFHQFPNLFLISNIIAVPLAAIILYSAIALVTFSWIPFAGEYLGKLVGGFTWVLNKCILSINNLSYAVWDSMHATVLSTWLLYAVVIGFCMGVIGKSKKYIHVGLFASLAFVMQYSFLKWQTAKQQKIIVYNVPQQQAIDFISGNQYQFAGDSILLKKSLLQNFHLKPGRIAHQLTHSSPVLTNLFQYDIFYRFGNKKILLIDKTIDFGTVRNKMDLDLIIFSKDPKISIKQLNAVFNCKQFVFDASNPTWRIDKWKMECETLQLRYYSIPERGAFIYDIGI